ncbi:MAG TPA: Ig-like domain-containing protein [Kofleriaceae bacterium]|nr:Ig-like domain-containing protein [Kofleriaceae bacterium]
MLRLSVSTGLAVAAVTLASAAALAETNGSTDPVVTPVVGPRLAVPTPLDQFTTVPHAQISNTLYLERCKGGCTVTQGPNDARAMTSSIPQTAGAHPISEYRNGAGKTGAEADAEWNLLLKCMREVYSPFSVTVTDAKPTGASYHMAIIAGIPQEIDLGPDILGVAPLANDCSPQDNVISFSFANAHPQTETTSRVNNLCWTAAQESAHAFGLDHQFEFVVDKRSACNDPMTYRVDCGGQKFFRNASATCGEFQPRPCRCGGSQNSHVKLLGIFGAGQSLIPPPTSVITTPKPGDTALPGTVVAEAISQRGVAKVELYINGSKWAEVKGARFGQDGQERAPYGIPVPAALPNSIVDVMVRAYDDLGNATDSATVTVTRGAPCESADTCAKGQKCEAGRCFWEPAAGELGDECEYPQFCVSGICRGTAERQICTQECIPNVEDSCPSDYSCVPTEPNVGICFNADDGGCCSTTRQGGGVPWAPVAFAMLTLGYLARPRRRGR